ncbi:hypothetical protein GCM10022255_063290 [Dactylosporangium darangshiense]|uniref:4Fe-4S Wbl-type domain-containing protein n=1 Tax=Dactylosporangium darangshiense TaxID=579108 RepID=A0ABP8DG58_9ACTN
MDPETFFPAPTEPADAAVALCRTCDVQGACLAWALDVGDCHGVWGATTPRERRAMLVAWRNEVPGQVMPTAAGATDPRLGAVACLPIMPIQRAPRSHETPDPVGAAAQ